MSVRSVIPAVVSSGRYLQLQLNEACRLLTGASDGDYAAATGALTVIAGDAIRELLTAERAWQERNRREREQLEHQAAEEAREAAERQRQLTQW